MKASLLLSYPFEVFSVIVVDEATLLCWWRNSADHVNLNHVFQRETNKQTTVTFTQIINSHDSQAPQDTVKSFLHFDP